MAPTVSLCRATDSHSRSTRDYDRTHRPMPRRTPTSADHHAQARRLAHFLPRLGPRLLRDSSVYSSCTTGLARRSTPLLTPAGTFSTKIVTLKCIFPRPKSPRKAPLSLDGPPQRTDFRERHSRVFGSYYTCIPN